MITNKQKALIHVAKAKVGMSEAEYRALLAGVGVSSSTELTRAKFDAVMQRFEKLGFKSFKSQHKKRLKTTPDKKRLMSKLGAILADLGLPWGYADAIAQNRFGVDVAGWCDVHQLYTIVQMMAVHQRRKQRES